MEQAYLRQFEQLCTQESPPACQTMCPLHIETRTFLEHMREGKLRDARKCLERNMPLSSLVGLLCEGHCLAHCVRARVDEPVNVPLTEKTCVLNTSPGKPFPLPETGKRIAIVGATLSGLTVAYELAKKGHGLTVFYVNPSSYANPSASEDFSVQERSLTAAYARLLTEEFSAAFGEGVIARAVDEIFGQLKALKVVFTAVDFQAESATYNESATAANSNNSTGPANSASSRHTAQHFGDFLSEITQEYTAVYIGLDAKTLPFSPVEALKPYAPINEFTLQCAQTALFCGVHDSLIVGAHGKKLEHNLFEVGFSTSSLGEVTGNKENIDTGKNTGAEAHADEETCIERNGKSVLDVVATSLSPIERVAMGKRAAGSIDRFLQGVDPATAREGELVHPTALYTSTEGVKPAAVVVPLDSNSPAVGEGQAEAERCIRCSCLECVKHCSFLAEFETYPKKLARAIFNGLAIVKGFRQTNLATNSCAECGLCAAVCPNNADMGAFCATARKIMVRDKRMPPSAHEFALLDMEQSNDAEVAFCRHQPGSEASAYLFFPGCQLPASLPKETLWAYQHLCQHLEGGVGLYFHCCGAPARWSGRPMLTRSTADILQAQWEKCGKPEVIVACASCFEFFRAELPHIPCRSLWDVLDTTPLSPTPREGDTASAVQCFALHDPCAVRDYKDTQEAVRRILTKCAVPYEEMRHHGSLTRCCGYGGLVSAANPALGAKFAKVRAEESPLPTLAYCAVCRERLAAEGKETVHLLEVLRGVENWEKSLKRKPLGISERQYSRKAFKEEALKDIWNETAAATPQPPFALVYGDGVHERMEQRRIREADIVLVLEHARKNGALFQDANKQWSLASLRPKQVTFWVRYAETGPNEYCILDAYCHRMVVPGVPGEGQDSPATLEGFSAKAVC